MLSLTVMGAIQY